MSSSTKTAKSGYEKQRSDSKGNHSEMVADGEHRKKQNGSVDIEVTKSGNRSKASKDTVTWEEDVDGVAVDNDMGGKNIEKSRHRTNSKGRVMDEDKPAPDPQRGQRKNLPRS